MLRATIKADKAAQKKMLLAIFEDTWSQLDPNQRASIIQHRDLIDAVMGELLPGTHQLRVIRRSDVAAANEDYDY